MRRTADISSVGDLGFFVRRFSGLPQGHPWSDWGNNRATLTPDAGTNTLARSGFFLHGGRVPGSAGCIDVGSGEFSLFPLLIAHDGPITVAVQYPGSSTVTTPARPGATGNSRIPGDGWRN